MVNQIHAAAADPYPTWRDDGVAEPRVQHGGTKEDRHIYATASRGGGDELLQCDGRNMNPHVWQCVKARYAEICW